MDELQTKLLEYLNGAEKLIVENGPKAYDATVGLVSLNAWLTLIWGGVFVILAIGAATFVHHCAKKFPKEDRWGDVSDNKIMCYLFGNVPTVALVLIAATQLTSKSAWIGVINPELGLLWEVYQKFIG